MGCSCGGCTCGNGIQIVNPKNSDELSANFSAAEVEEIMYESSSLNEWRGITSYPLMDGSIEMGNKQYGE